MQIVVSICLITTALILSNCSFAASQGDLSATSKGTSEISVTLGLLARISGLSDFTFGNWNGGNLNADDNLCVGLFGASSYRIRAVGDGDGSDINGFALSNGSDFIPYRVFYNDQTGLPGRTELAAATSISGQTASAAFWNLFGCLFNNANLSILLEEPDLIAAGAGSYTGKLTLVVIPE